MKWWCGRCKEDVDELHDMKACHCRKSPSPWWYVPTTLFEKIRCFLGVCKYRSVCKVCQHV